MRIGQADSAPKLLTRLLRPLFESLTRYMGARGLILFAGPDDGPESFAEIGAFMDDNPEADLPDDEGAPADAGTSDEDNPRDDPEDPETDPDQADDEPEEDDESDEGDDEGKPKGRQGEEFEVTVKGEDGADIKKKVSLQELKNGYIGKAEVTRRFQEVAEQRQQAFEIVQRKEAEARDKYHTEAAVAVRAVYELAGLMSPEEMAALAARDPQAAFQEQARQNAVLAKIEEVRGRVVADREQGTAQQQQAMREAAAAAWEVLSNPQAKGFRQEPVKSEEVKPLFAAVNKHFKIPMERFANITDPALVLMMRSAVRYEEAKHKATGGQQPRKGQPERDAQREPPKPARTIPPPRQQAPRESRESEKRNRVFASGRAKISDLAAYLNANDR